MKAEKNTSMKRAVLREIQEGRVSARPKIYYVLKTALVILGLVLIGLFLVYVVSFVDFALRVNGTPFLTDFGPKGVLLFVKTLPWLLILAAVAMLIIVELLVRHFSFGYQRPVLYSTLGLVALVALGSVAISYSGFHNSGAERAHRGELPIAGMLYHGFGIEEMQPDVHRGEVIGIEDNGFSMVDHTGTLVVVVVSKETRWPLGRIAIGQQVFVAGERDGAIIQAFGVRPLSSTTPFLRHRMKMRKHDQGIPPMPMRIPR